MNNKNKLNFSKQNSILKEDILNNINNNDKAWIIISPILKDWNNEYKLKIIDKLQIYPIAINPSKYKNIWIDYYLCSQYKNLKNQDIKALYILEVWKKFENWEDFFLDGELNDLASIRYTNKYVFNIERTNNSYIVKSFYDIKDKKYIYSIYFEEFDDKDWSFTIMKKDTLFYNKELNIKNIQTILKKNYN